MHKFPNIPQNILVSADIIGKLKIGLSLCKPRRYVWERGGIALLILKLDTRWRLMVSVMARLLRHPGKRTQRTP